MHIGPFICTLVLFVNALWDFISCLAIWGSFCTLDVQALSNEEEDEESAPQTNTLMHATASMHTSMWTRHVDTNNHAACMLMAWWVFTLGCIRLASAGAYTSGNNSRCLVLGLASYCIEGIAFLIEGFKGTMVPSKACPEGLFSLLCWVLLLGFIPGDT